MQTETGRGPLEIEAELDGARAAVAAAEAAERFAYEVVSAQRLALVAGEISRRQFLVAQRRLAESQEACEIIRLRYRLLDTQLDRQAEAADRTSPHPTMTD